MTVPLLTLSLILITAAVGCGQRAPVVEVSTAKTRPIPANGSRFSRPESDRFKVERISQTLRPEVDLALKHSPIFELYSLDHTDTVLELEQRIDVPGRYFGRKILGRVTLNDQKTRDEIGNAFRAATSEPENIAVACFFPRHGIRIEHEFHRIDLLICFECFTVYVYRDGLQIDGMKTTDAAAPVFDRVLEAAGIPLAKKKGE